MNDQYFRRSQMGKSATSAVDRVDPDERTADRADNPHIGALFSPESLENTHYIYSRDQTPEGGPKRVRRHMTEAEAARYRDGSWRIRILKYVARSPAR